MKRYQFMFELQNHLISMDEVMTWESKIGQRHGLHFRTKIGSYGIRIDKVYGAFKLRMRLGFDDDALGMACDYAGFDVTGHRVLIVEDNPLVMARKLVQLAKLIDNR